MLNWLTSNIQLVVVILMVLGPSIGGIAKWFAEQQKKLKAKQELARRREEELRTGRPVEPAIKADPQAEARARAAELLRRQQAEAELKRKQAELRAEQARRLEQARRAAQARRAQQQAQASGIEFDFEPGMFAPVLQAPAPAKSDVRVESAMTQARVAKTANAASAAGRAAAATARAPAAPLLGTVGIADLRKAVVLSEILSPPVSLRGDHLT